MMNKPELQLASVTRGLYRRVADKFGVDPSYVSRIARGERQNPQIELFLRRETGRILASISTPKGKRKKR
jgi:hypothetical protein